MASIEISRGDLVEVEMPASYSMGPQLGVVLDVSSSLVWVSFERLLLPGQGKYVCSRNKILRVVDDAEVCPHLIESQIERRPGNALNLEIGASACRCLLKTPKNWGSMPASRWLDSGGSVFVFGPCSSVCPKSLT